MAKGIGLAKETLIGEMICVFHTVRTKIYSKYLGSAT